MDSDVLNTSTDDYLTRAAFRSYSDAMDNEPYIVAEIDANNYPATFALGDNALTFMYSDFPNLDFNGPLMEGTLYSYFVRFFSPRPQVNHVIRYSNCAIILLLLQEARAKRNVDDRQYSVFTTTGFISVISTGMYTIATLISLQIREPCYNCFPVSLITCYS